jgi:transcriptional regulator with XRE-family HTH domain
MSRAGVGIVGERFGENLRRVRRREGLSQEQLAMRASLHRTEVGKLERAGRLCRIDTLIRLAGAWRSRPKNFSTGSTGCRDRSRLAPSSSAPAPGRRRRG